MKARGREETWKDKYVSLSIKEKGGTLRQGDREDKVRGEIYL